VTKVTARRLIAWLLFGVALPAAAADPAVDKWIAAHASRLGGVEQRPVRYAVVGDLDGDGRDDVAVLYTIDGANPGKRSLRYLAAFRRNAAALEFSAHALVGGRGIREVNRATILARTIELETLEYGPLDAVCCPGIPVRSRYRLVDGRLSRLDARSSGARPDAAR
jgi:hypothetical protein